MTAIRIFRRLAELLDVAVSAPTDGQVLTYDTGTSKWRNEDANSGSSSFLEHTVTVPSASLLALADTPYTLIPSPGPGKAIALVTVLALYNFGTVAYVSGNAEVINYGTDHSDRYAPFAVPFLESTESVSGLWIVSDTGIGGQMPQSIVEDTAVVLSVDNLAANPTDGDGTLTFVISYYERTFA